VRSVGIAGGPQGQAGQGVRGQGPQLHLRLQVPHPLRRRQVHGVRPHLRQRRGGQEVRAQVQAHQGTRLVLPHPLLVTDQL
jgi:hypothetical protein